MVRSVHDQVLAHDGQADEAKIGASEIYTSAFQSYSLLKKSKDMSETQRYSCGSSLSSKNSCMGLGEFSIVIVG